MNIFLHIGHPKTATTSFQRVAEQFRDVLAENGVLYPEDPTIFPYQHGGTLAPLVRGNGTEAQWDLIEGWTSGPHDTLVLSAEALSQFKPGEAAGFIQRLKNYGTVHVIYTLRPWHSFLRSHYRFVINFGDSLSWHDYLRACGDSFDENADIHFGRVIDEYMAGQPDHFHPIFYGDDNVMERLMDITGMNDALAHKHNLSRVKAVHHNTSDSRVLRNIIRLANHARNTRKNRSADARFYETLRGGSGELWQPTLYDVADKILKSDQYGPQMTTLLTGSEMALPHPARPDLAQWAQAVDRVLTRHNLPNLPKSWYADVPENLWQGMELKLEALPADLRRAVEGGPSGV